MGVDLSELHPDLRPHVQDEPELGGPILRHPLVTDLTLTRNVSSQMLADMGFKSNIERVNGHYEAKRSAMVAAREAEDWKTFVFVYERPYRLWALQEVIEANDFQMASLWPLVGDVWIDCENIQRDRDEWLDIWRDDCPKRYRAMSKSERARLARLPDQITIWRGVGNDDAIEGLSWTLLRAKAEWFARRFASVDGPPLLVHGRVDKTAVFAYFSSRKEAEIVTDPDSVVMVDVARLPPKVI